MARDMMAILGENVVNEMTVGFDWSSLVSATANVAKTGIDQKQAADASAKTKAESDAALKKSIDADLQWMNAEANLELAGSDSTASTAGRVLRDAAKAVAVAAAGALQGDAVTKRCTTAQDAYKAAASAAVSAPKDIAKQAKFHGWQKVVDSCGAPPTSADTALAHDTRSAKEVAASGGSWITKKAGGLPVWGWGLVGVGGLSILTLLIRSFSSKRR